MGRRADKHEARQVRAQGPAEEAGEAAGEQERSPARARSAGAGARQHATQTEDQAGRTGRRPGASSPVAAGHVVAQAGQWARALGAAGRSVRGGQQHGRRGQGPAEAADGPTCVWVGSPSSRWGKRSDRQLGAEGRQQPEAHGEGHEGDREVEAVLGAQGRRLHGREGQLAAQEQEVRGGQVEHIDGEGALLDVEAGCQSTSAFPSSPRCPRPG